MNQHNNKGFTLVELIISFTLLSIIAIPLFSMFIVSARTTERAREIGDGTIAAENLMEEFEAMDFESWNQNQTLTPPTLTSLGSGGNAGINVNFFESTPNDIYVVTSYPRTNFNYENFENIMFVYNDIAVGENTFDALVTLRPGDSDASAPPTDFQYYRINSLPIANFTPTNNAYNQTKGFNNPDEAAWEFFRTELSSRGLTLGDKFNPQYNPQRTITMEMSETGSGADLRVHATVKYEYEFTIPGTTDKVEYETAAFRITPSDGTDPSIEDAATFHLMFYPWYYGNSSTEDFIVVDAAIDSLTNVVLVKKPDTDPEIVANLTALENSYDASVYLIQKFSEDLYIKPGGPFSTPTGIEIGGNLVTNIGEPIEGSGVISYPTNNINYYISNGSGIFTDDALDSEDNLVISERKHQIYTFSVDLYEDNVVNRTGTDSNGYVTYSNSFSTATPIYTLESSSSQ